MTQSKPIRSYKSIYFLGIGGIGMSAISRWFHVNGYQVAGYDKTATRLTATLEQEGIAIHFTDDVSQIDDTYKNSEDTLVVLTPAIPKDHTEWAYFREHGFTILKRSQVLGLLTEEMFLIAVAGTHGKTTTSSMVAHILKHSGRNVAAFLGGITQNYHTNFLLNDPTEHLRDVLCVVEADEFDRSFLTLHPDLAIVTSTDADHLDIYGSGEEVLKSFGDFVSQIKPEGTLFLRNGLSLSNQTRAQIRTYSFEAGAFHVENCRIADNRFKFSIVYPEGICEDIALLVPGFHNAENAVAAFAVCLKAGLSPEEIREGINSYRGVKRRFEYHLQHPEAIYIDDYAHHPTEVEAFLKSVKALYPGKNVTAIFQPHLFTRTRDFQEGFAESLSLADRVILLDIYPARELPIPGITSEIIFEKITSAEKIRCQKDNVLEVLKTIPIEILVTIGAGDIDTLIDPIRFYLEGQIAGK
ncbi:UDP-N-acetylmuramate--L-alanine ligase [Siphonobacter sp. SORGH_AS_0500]|uniref:UDP-N-acetylmuramate--L-alanine ligase n=1 Tax=Siphonobacter sp. SORGH_AS_0500 TaxID=1864824 RepID=UPI0028614C7A|nr:UDP-N-acetylmuramate--L-alanine ligase [Siphonobacter sp. SORGH_AS_0500]MDR6193486.1 UDP-N-acetylmuramate--alanine ligase [Siphonobacter sp. SORGH_AS_0500]